MHFLLVIAVTALSANSATFLLARFPLQALNREDTVQQNLPMEKTVKARTNANSYDPLLLAEHWAEAEEEAEDDEVPASAARTCQGMAATVGDGSAVGEDGEQEEDTAHDLSTTHYTGNLRITKLHDYTQPTTITETNKNQQHIHMSFSDTYWLDTIGSTPQYHLNCIKMPTVEHDK